MVFAADRVILDGSHGRLPGVNDFQVLDAALAALGAHDLGQRADGSLINIRDLEAGRVHLVACTHGADDGDASLLALHDQRNFTGDRVDGVHHVVELAEIEAVLRLRAKEGLVGGDLDVGVDVVDALFGHIHLEPAHRLVGGDDLAVQVGEADFVVVDQVESPHAAAGQRLDGVAAHAAHAEHGYAGIVQFGHCFRAQQQLGAGILVLHIISPLGSAFYIHGLALSVTFGDSSPKGRARMQRSGNRLWRKAPERARPLPLIPSPPV